MRGIGGLILAFLLAVLAGWVDAVGFVHWPGLFVSFMSGNTTKMVVASTEANWTQAWPAGRAILAFFCGICLGEVASILAGRWRRPSVLGLEALFLGLGLWCSVTARPEAEATVVLGLAMGVQNGTVHEAEGISVTLTYFTGSLVHVGRALARALCGKGLWRTVMPYLGLYASLILGAIGGSILTRSLEAEALAIATGFAAFLAVATGLIELRQASRHENASEPLENHKSQQISSIQS